MNNIKISSILALAAAALMTAACDPFPKAPGGAPQVLRAVSFGQSTGGNIEESGDFPNPTAIVVEDATGDANFFVWFTKEMDGTTIQALPDFDPLTGLPTATEPCDLAGSPLTTSGNFPDGTTLCYASGSAQGGGLIQITPGAALDVGVYTVGGTVKDYQGNSLTFNATFNVTHKPWVVPTDGYTVDVGWTNDSTATGFTIERTSDANAAGDAPAAGAVWDTLVTGFAWAAPPANGSNAIFRNAGLEPGGTYFYRITPEGVAGAAPSTFQVAHTAGVPNIKTVVNPTLVGGGATTGTVQIALARIRSAAYRVQIAELAAPDTWVDVDPANITNTAGTALDAVPSNPLAPRAANPLIFNVKNLAAGTYLARIVPEWTGVVGTPDGPGTPTNTSQFTIP